MRFHIELEQAGSQVQRDFDKHDRVSLQSPEGRAEKTWSTKLAWKRRIIHVQRQFSDRRRSFSVQALRLALVRAAWPAS